MLTGAWAVSSKQGTTKQGTNMTTRTIITYNE